jgi:hypothetical protein
MKGRLSLSDDDDLAVRLAAATAMGRVGCDRFLPRLVEKLGAHEESAAARQALVDVGERAAVALEAVIANRELACETSRGTRFRYGPGTGVGGVDTVAIRPRWYTATAETPILGLRPKVDRFVDLLENDYSLAGNFLASLSNALIGVLARKAELGHDPLAQKRDVSRLGVVPVGA